MNEKTNELLEKTQAMIWDLLDDRISDADFLQLEELLRDDEQVREIYLQCVQIHVDLMGIFTGQSPAVFKFANGDLLTPPIGFELSGGEACTEMA